MGGTQFYPTYTDAGRSEEPLGGLNQDGGWPEKEAGQTSSSTALPGYRGFEVWETERRHLQQQGGEGKGKPQKKRTLGWGRRQRVTTDVILLRVRPLIVGEQLGLNNEVGIRRVSVVQGEFVSKAPAEHTDRQSDERDRGPELSPTYCVL